MSPITQTHTESPCSPCHEHITVSDNLIKEAEHGVMDTDFGLRKDVANMFLMSSSAVVVITVDEQPGWT